MINDIVRRTIQFGSAILIIGCCVFMPWRNLDGDGWYSELLQQLFAPGTLTYSPVWKQPAPGAEIHWMYLALELALIVFATLYLNDTFPDDKPPVARKESA